VKKLKLDADALEVDSFDAAAVPAEPAEGSVEGFVLATRPRDTCGHTVCCPETSTLQCSVTGIC
jgi:hypothetical protein